MHKKITQIIHEYLARPLAVSHEAAAFAESALGISETDELMEFLSLRDADDSGLLDLLFSPPEELRERLEDFIPPKGFTEREIELLIKNIMKEVKKVVIREQENGASGTLSLTEEILSSFIASLRLTSSVPRVFDHPEGSSLQIPPSFRSSLRRHWHRLTAPAQKPLLALAEALSREETESRESSLLINRAAAILGKIKDTDDAYELLSRQKQACEKLMDGIRYFTEMEKKYSMDILMSMRLTPPPESFDDLMNETIAIDRISRLLFGIPARGSAPERNVAMKKNSLGELW